MVSGFGVEGKTPVLENQLETKTKHEMETMLLQAIITRYSSYLNPYTTDLINII